MNKEELMETESENSGKKSVIVPLYSRFSFEDIPVEGEGGDPLNALEKIRASLGEEWASLAELNGDQTFVTIRSPPDMPGRGRLPKGAYARAMSKWTTKLVFPDTGEELSDDQVDMSTEEVASRNGRVVCVIPVTFTLSPPATS